MRPCFTLLIVVAVSLHASAVSTTNSNGSVMTPNSELTRNQLVATDVSGLLSSESDPNVVFTNGELLVHGERVKIGPDETEVQEIASAAVAPVASSVTNLSSSVSDLQSSKADRSEIPGNYLSVSNKAMTAVQVESDPTVPAWAKQATPPQTMTTNAVDALANSAVVTNALTVATTNRVALLESSKADNTALTAHVANTNNPHAVTAAQVCALPLVEDSKGNKTAVTIGDRKDGELVGEYSFANGGNVTASGRYSHAEGTDTTASENSSHAEGYGTSANGYSSHAEGYGTSANGYSSHAEGYDTTANGNFSHAEGYYANANEIYSFAWNGDDQIQQYTSHGKGTFNINPAGGLNGFWIGEQTLYAILTNKADKSALNSHVENKSNPHAVTAAQVGAVPFVEDASGYKTAVTIGLRVIGTPVGGYSFANGSDVTAYGQYSHAEGAGTTAAGDYSHAEGISTTASGYSSHAEGVKAKTKEQDNFAFAWNGDSERDEYDPYESNGPGTFNINPVGGLNGFWIGEQTLGGILALKADKSAISATNPTFSNAVLAVGLNIDTNSVAVLNEIAKTSGGFPIEGTATTVGGLLAALAAAAAWLKKNKVGSFADVGGASATVENGVAKLSGFFTESNSLLTGTIDARLPYPLYAVPSTGLLKDRAINTTSLASVTVPDNFTDLLVRASVASSLAVTMPAAIATKYGDTFPGEAGEYLITITKTGATEAYVRTIKLEEVA